MGYIIYKHTNKINGKVYIGQTHRNIKARWGKAGEYYKQCSKFWNAIQKYGWENFEHTILVDSIKTQIEANKKEQEYIELYDSINNGYNISKGGFDKSYCTIPIYQLDNNKNILAEFESAAEAERLLKIDRGSISRCCLQKAITAGGYCWCFVKDYNKYQIKAKSTRLSREKAVMQLDKKTDKIIKIYPSMSEAARQLTGNVNNGKHIGQCCIGERKTACGYKWRYVDEER